MSRCRLRSSATSALGMHTSNDSSKHNTQRTCSM
jgi:hypothetical protein